MNKANPRWWQDCIGYIIYPASFCDSNGDGIGDIPGIISKLDYLADLGVDLLWICPLFDSPMDDNGYDVSDYYKINPRFGNNDDFKRLLEEAHNRGIAVCIDFVLNHTSDEHPWFKKALEDPTSKERGYYFFEKGHYVGGKLLPPNNWKGFFSTSVWERLGDSDMFFLHIFSSKMPDVNWANPAVRDQYVDIANYYMDLGVDGFRIDAVAHLAKDMTFEDSTLPSDPNGLVYDPSKFSNREELFGYLQEMKQRVFAPRNALTIGEVGGSPTPEQALRLVDRDSGSLTMIFNFDTVWNNGSYGSIDKKDEEIFTDVIRLKNNFMRWYDGCHERADLPLYWCNHDHPRVVSMYGDKRYRKQSAKALIAILLFFYGVPFIYQGDELGMTNMESSRPEDFFCDVGNKNEVIYLRGQGYPDEQIAHYLSRCSRNNARQPMPWNAGPYGGFSTVEPILPGNHDYEQGVNAEDEEQDPDSILNFTKDAIALRKMPFMQRLIREGQLTILDPNHPDVLAYIHEGEEKIILIASMRPYDTYFSFYWTIQDVYLHNYGDTIFENHVFHLRPFECFLLKV